MTKETLLNNTKHTFVKLQYLDTSIGSWLGERMLHPTSSIPSGHCSTPSQRCRRGMHRGLTRVISQLNVTALQPVKELACSCLRYSFFKDFATEMFVFTSASSFVFKERTVKYAVTNLTGIHATATRAFYFIGGSWTVYFSITYLLDEDCVVR